MRNRNVRWKNIGLLISGSGEIIIGRIGAIRCAAVAADGDQQLAALVRDAWETFEHLPDRLDDGIGKAWEDEEFVDEMNG